MLRVGTGTEGARPRAASRTDSRKSSLGASAGMVTHNSAVLCCAFSPDNTHLVSGDLDGFVKIHVITKGDLQQELKGVVPHQQVAIQSCCFTCDSRHLALALSDHRINVYKVGGQQEWHRSTLEHPDSAVRDCCVSVGAPSNVVSAAGQYIWKWDLRREGGESCVRYNSFQAAYNLTSCALSPDGSIIAGGTTHRAILLWNAMTGAVVGNFKGAETNC